MSKRIADLYLDDILSSLKKIEDYTKGLSQDDFYKDVKTVDAVIRNLEIIGEAAKNIPSEFRENHPDAPWKEMISMRNKVLHEYSGVDLEILWKTVKEDLPQLKKQTERLANK